MIRTGTRGAWSAALIIAVTCATVACNDQTSLGPTPEDPVKIESGLVAGKLLQNGVKAYLGVPYAAPPVGPLRWREPQPVVPWEGVYNADRFGNKCPQPADVTPEGMSEDCLYLNIWAPPTAKAGEELPVILYFHGGQMGGSNSGARPFYNGQNLATKGVIHITMNFRMGAFAHFAHPELTAESPYHSSGNYDHYDQLAAMKWVQRNIAALGGDPENVNLMGLSSGGITTGFHEASAATQGLYKRVIGLSGSAFDGPYQAATVQDAEEAGQRFMEGLGVETLAEMRAMPMLRLLESVPGVTLWGAAVDGYLLTESPEAVFQAGKQVDVPALYGNSAHEGGGIGQVETMEEFREAVTKMAGPKADRVFELYPVSSDEDVPAVVLKLNNELDFSRQMVRRSRIHVETGNTPVYLALFARAPANHGYDLPYWFNVLDLPGAVVDSEREIDATDYEIAEKMSDALAAFVKTGDPSTPDVDWPRYTRENEVRMVFGDAIEVAPVSEGIKFFLDNPDVSPEAAQPGVGTTPRPAGAPL